MVTPPPSHPDFEIVGVYINFKDRETIFHDRTIVPLPELKLEIPEHTKYHLTLKFKVKNRKLTGLRYLQVVRTARVAVKTRECVIGDYEPSEEIYAKDFPEDETPGGIMLRGNYTATSTYYAGDELLMETPWKLVITK